MRVTFSFCILLALSLTIFPLLQPLQAGWPPEKADCCQQMKRGDGGEDCGRQMPKSGQDQACCATCVYGLDLYLASTARLPEPPSADLSFPSYILREEFRREPPPSPPPRAQFA